MLIIICKALHTETDQSCLIYKDDKGIVRLLKFNKNISSDNKKLDILGRLNELKVTNEYTNVNYKHFKGGKYRSLVNAFDFNGNEFMIYQNIDPDQKDKYMKIYARPIEMFKSLVDKEKYPNVKQKYRFEKES